jgi:hypothetical protein
LGIRRLGLWRLGYGGWGYGGYWPWYLDWGWGYPYNNGYYGPYYYPDTSGYYYSYLPSDAGDYYASAPPDYAGDYSYSPADYYGDSGPAANPFLTAPQQYAGDPEAGSGLSANGQQGPGQQQGPDQALQYYSDARAAFLRGDYQDALRLSGHAGVDEPRNPKVHESISLALFAQGNYGPAAGEAHAALALGPTTEWKDLYGYYNDVNKYTTQLRALEQAVAANPNSAAEHFLLGYHYLMTGQRDNAQTQFAQAAKLTPGDKLAAHYLQELQSNAPLAPPQMATRSHGTQL